MALLGGRPCMVYITSFPPDNSTHQIERYRRQPKWPRASKGVLPAAKTTNPTGPHCSARPCPSKFKAEKATTQERHLGKEVLGMQLVTRKAGTGQPLTPGSCQSLRPQNGGGRTPRANRWFSVAFPLNQPHNSLAEWMAQKKSILYIYH